MPDTSFSILVFGIAKDIMGGSNIQLDIAMPTTVEQLKHHILTNYPAFQDVSSLAVAVNNEYSTGLDPINIGDEVAIIPPVSGG